jgi:hypothetical protein
VTQELSFQKVKEGIMLISARIIGRSETLNKSELLSMEGIFIRLKTLQR